MSQARLSKLIKSPSCTPEALAGHLDGLAHAERLQQVRGLCYFVLCRGTV